MCVKKIAKWTLQNAHFLRFLQKKERSHQNRPQQTAQSRKTKVESKRKSGPIRIDRSKAAQSRKTKVESKRKRPIRIDRSKAAQSRKTKVESKRKRLERSLLHVPQEHYTAH